MLSKLGPRTTAFTCVRWQVRSHMASDAPWL